MTTQTLPPPIMTATEPVVRRWTKDEFYELAEQGFFTGQRAELIEGEIMVQSPQKAEHFTAADRVRDVLAAAFGPGFQVRMQGPLDLGLHTEPEPDAAVVPGKREDYLHAHPQIAALIVEVSDTTLAADQTRKASLYARGGITDYWIVNLVADQLEVYRDPVPDATQPYGHRYAHTTVHLRGMTLAPLGCPGAAIAVTSLLG